MRITKTEMKKIFKEENLNLGFPSDAKSGDNITDWNLHYGKTKYENSDLKKFTDLMATEKYKEYTVLTSVFMSTVRVTKQFIL